MLASCGRGEGRLTSRQSRIAAAILEHRAWIVDAMGGEALGLGGLREQSFCQSAWRDHFNPGGPSDANFRTVDVKDAADVCVAGLVSQLSFELTRDSVFAAARADGLDMRPAEGWQFSLGGGRAWHPDAEHLGGFILTVTLEGDCEIEVQDCAAKCAFTATPWRPRRQVAGSYYAIWGPSLKPIKHRVLPGAQARLSLTMRFVRVPTPYKGWRPGDACVARFGAQRRGEAAPRWYPGRVTLVDRNAECCDVQYDDGDTEAHIPWRFMLTGGDRPASHNRQSRADSRKRRRSEMGN